jgi:hypothetical protein
MALIIKATENKKIKIAGTELELPEVYGRIEFVGRSNGITLEIATATYTSKTTYEQGMPVFTDIPSGNVNANIDPATQEQSLITAHEYGKMAYEQLGYEVTIDLQ